MGEFGRSPDPVEIRKLAREDDRGGFASGQPDIDRFFQHYAGQNQFRLHLAVSWVAVAGADLLGFVTIAGGSVERRTMPDATLRKRLPDHPVPVLRLARLGVDLRAQGRGIGAQLVRHVLRIALVQRDQVGCAGVVTDAKPVAVPFYDRLGFVTLDGVREGTLHGDPTPMFLSIAAIARAVASPGARR